MVVQQVYYIASLTQLRLVIGTSTPPELADRDDGFVTQSAVLAGASLPFMRDRSHLPIYSFKNVNWPRNFLEDKPALGILNIIADPYC